MKTICSIGVLLCLGLYSNVLFSQYNETIQSDRPGQANGPNTAGAHVFQVQTGVVYNEISSPSIKSRIGSYDLTMRYGILENLELRGALNLQMLSGEKNNLPFDFEGMTFAQIGGRIHLLEGKKIVPEIGFQSQAIFYNPDISISTIGLNNLLSLSNSLTEQLSYTLNLGYLWNENSSSSSTFYVVNLSYGFLENFAVFAEVFGNEFIDQPGFDFGGSYLINDDLLIDLTTGFRGGSPQNDFFFDVGVSFRIHHHEESESEEL